MAHHKRKGPKSTRCGCLLCKPHKHQAERRRQRSRGDRCWREQEMSADQGRRVARLLPEAHNRQCPAVVHRRLVTLQRVELQRRIAEGAGEFLLFALTPPRLTTEPEQASQIAAKTLERLRPVGLDGLVLYDIDDESDRNPEERPFPFLPTMDPADYLARDLVGLEVPAIVYRAVSKYPEQGLRSWLSEQAPTHALSVFVGASSREKAVATSLLRAYELRTEVRPDLLLGGVAIPERHTRGRGEHVRLLAKQAAGCSFFVTQIIYDVNAAKNLVSDYHYACAARDVKPAPIVFTFSVCGSLKTLEFVQWLGVNVPHWIENELRHADNTLDASYDQAVATAVELIAFCRRVGVPFGLTSRASRSAKSRSRPPSASPPGYKQSYVASPSDLIVSSCWRAILDPEEWPAVLAKAGCLSPRLHQDGDSDRRGAAFRKRSCLC